ncbi:septum site-determining protein Ssd [Cellulomonas persica]|uniref:Uncharacterized protein n=1 Tax=Cellulomonas persica TaxID=76861 RepID=A0A510US54_9CELL|nr:septum site-determining protein Ssd [Cellulomonas persica]GEK17429.1 hypothetical protein CPE01_11620 [Cellulomonas persica]
MRASGELEDWQAERQTGEWQASDRWPLAGPAVASPTASARPGARVIGVVGGRGGAGASTFAAALAARFARRTATALVDLDRCGAGIDVLLALEDSDGVRWPDLTSARGDVDGAQVLALLPRWGPCAVLSADRRRPTFPEPGVVADVLHALACACGVVVVDLERAGVVTGESVAAACDAIVVLAPRDLRTVAGVLAMRDRLVGHGALVGLVACGPSPGGLSADELSHAVDLPVLARMGVDRRTAAATERGGVPLTGAVARAAARVARAVGTDPPAGSGLAHGGAVAAGGVPALRQGAW